MTISVDPQTFGDILRSAVRYATGRQTYIVSTTAEWVKAYGSQLPTPLLQGIREDIKGDLEISKRLNGKLGSYADDRVWSELVEWLDETIEAQLEAGRRERLTATFGERGKRARGRGFP